MDSCTHACRQTCVNTPRTAAPSTSEAHVGSGAVLAGLEPDHAPGEAPAVHAHPPWLDARRCLVRPPRESDEDEDTSDPRLGDPLALRLRRSVRQWFPTPVRIRSKGRQACFGHTLDKHTYMYTSSLPSSLSLSLNVCGLDKFGPHRQCGPLDHRGRPARACARHAHIPPKGTSCVRE